MHDITRSAFDDVTLEGLRRRRSSKWTHYPPDVIPAWVAEMDFPVAEPVRLAVIEAAERDDFGYAPWTEDSGLREVMAGWADRTYGWKVDRDRVLILPDVVKALLAGLLAFDRAGRRRRHPAAGLPALFQRGEGDRQDTHREPARRKREPVRD